MTSHKKIGIVTFHKTTSYGAMLQSYALLQTMKKLFPTSTVGLIDLYPKRFARHSNDKNYHLFYDFSQRFLPTITAENETLQGCLQNVKENNEPVTDLLCGSDQIWNPRIVKECLRDYFMYGNLGNVNKYSFAASFGVSELETDSESARIITEALSSYRKISVRESSGIALCGKFGRYDAVNVLDPTLNADPAIYSNFLKHNSFADRVCGFFLAREKYHTEVLKKISNGLCKQPLMLGSKSPFLSFIKSFSAPTVEEFVSTISQSSCVVTDSFHGVCFSIIFRRQFVVLPSHRKERFVRIAELLQILGLTDRVADDYRQASQIALRAINYDKVHMILAAERQRGWDFLRQCFAE